MSLTAEQVVRRCDCDNIGGDGGEPGGASDCPGLLYDSGALGPEQELQMMDKPLLLY